MNPFPQLSLTGQPESITPVNIEECSGSVLETVKSPLTGTTNIFSRDEAPLYKTHLEAVIRRYSPEGPAEAFLVQSIADAEWRLTRYYAIEDGLRRLHLKEFGVGAEIIPPQPVFAHQELGRRVQMVIMRTHRFRESDLDELATCRARRRAKREEVRRRHVPEGERPRLEVVVKALKPQNRAPIRWSRLYGNPQQSIGPKR